jgi:hypothetical protein
MQPNAARLAALVVAVCALGCSGNGGAGGGTAPRAVSPTASQESWFRDVANDRGLASVPDERSSDPFFMPKQMGEGVAILDIDNDGLMDVFIGPRGPAGAGTPSRLFRQAASGRFEEVAKAAGVEVFGYGQGAAAADVDNDGWTDLLATAYGRVWLFRNAGGGRFADISAASGIDNPHWAVSAAFGDLDRDGWLDLVIANYVAYDPSRRCQGNGGQPDFCGPSAFPGTVTSVFKNRGSARGARFESVTLSSGFARLPSPGLGVVIADFDGNQMPDVFVANDGRANHLWVNQGNMRFKEEGLAWGLAYDAMGRPEANMGVALGDIDGNGLFDLFVTHLTTELHRAWTQDSPGMFRDATARLGLVAGRRTTGFGALLEDFDNDGDEDLVFVNGAIRRDQNIRPADEGESFWLPYREENSLFENDGKTLHPVAARAASLGPPGVYRVIATSDFNNDGRTDLVATRLDGAALLLENTTTTGAAHHWVTVSVVEPALRRASYDAVLTVKAGGRAWTRWMNPGKGFAASVDPRAHVGLGAAHSIDEFVVRWPDGETESFEGGPADRFVTLAKGSGRRQSGARGAR